MTSQHILARRVLEERRKTGLDKKQFCLMAGISRPLLNKIEGKRANLTLSKLNQIASALNVETWTLLCPTPFCELTDEDIENTSVTLIKKGSASTAHDGSQRFDA